MRAVPHAFAALAALALHAAAIATEAPLWFDGRQPTAEAQFAVRLLVRSTTHGLDPADYDADNLARAVSEASTGATDANAVAALDRRLTAAMERFLVDLHRGRIAPGQLPRGYAGTKADGFDPAALLRGAVARHRLAEAVEQAAPRLSQYERLREALARYRTMDSRAWSTSLPPLPPARGAPQKLEPGQPYAGARMLRDRLVALGDLPASTTASALYDDALAAGVRAFQQRHGLATDGVIGRATFAQLEVPPSARARQIELMLERLRWTPLMLGPRMIVVNVPEFTLRAYEVQGERIAVQATMKVIVGKALNTRTPLFVEQMRFIEFQPFWNVPPSIARGEVVPRLRRDPGYWDREGFEFVVDGNTVTTLSTALLDETLAGRARIRQRPGPKNALGDIKFVFPNNENIYLHHTPAVSLFGRERRDFSHGCIRVEEPVALALFVLKDRPEWDEARIRRAMSDDDPLTLRLSEPVPVLIAYGTAMVKEGRVYFYEDLYGHDRALDAALRARPVTTKP